MEEYELQGLLGKGAYGDVHCARSKRTGLEVAIKRIHLPREEVSRKQLEQEVAIQRQLRHTSIVRVEASFVDRSHFYIVMERMERSLIDFIRQKKGGLSGSTIKSIAYQLLVGIHHIHDHQIIHRDICPENILLRKSDVKISDFGIATTHTHSQQHTPLVTKRWYRAPEVILGGGNYDFSIDIWSYATVVAELVLGYPLFPGTSDLDQLHVMVAILGTPSQDTWPSGYAKVRHMLTLVPTTPALSLMQVFPQVDGLLVEMLAAVLQYEPERRPDAWTLLQAPYFHS